MNILLFGSEGILGKELAKIFRKKFHLTCIDFKKKNYTNKFINLDLSKKINSPILNKKFDVGIILSFYKSQPVEFNKTNRKEFNRINNKILENSLTICRKNNIRKIIYLSSCTVYSENLHIKKISEKFKLRPNNIYGKFKLKAERKILDYGVKFNLNCINLRLFNYYTKRGNILIEHLKKQIKKGKVFINGDGNQCRDFLHIDDISDALIKIINSKIRNTTCNLCSGNPTKINKILYKLISITNKNLNNIEYTGKTKSSFYLVGENKKLKKLIGWKIKNNFNNFIK